MLPRPRGALGSTSVATKFVARPTAVLQLVEASHDSGGDLQAWADQLIAAGKSLMASSAFNVGIARRGQRGFEIMGASSVFPGLIDFWLKLMPTIDPALLDRFWRYPHFVSSAAHIASTHPHPGGVDGFYELVGARDILGVVALVDDISVTLGAPFDATLEIAPRDRQLLVQVALHIEAGLRLRVRPNDQLAILRPDGRLLHADGSARDLQTRERLAHHVGLVERSRTRRARQQAESVDAWSALVAGRWGLVERHEPGGSRHYAVLETTRGRHLHALTELETHAVELSARGLSGKSVAYALGVAPSAVSRHLAAAALKLGVQSRTDLVRMVARLLRSGPVRELAGSLTRSEMDVLSLVRLGWSNAKIAKQRGRSEHTIANQIAALLFKLEVPSRRALAAVNGAE